MMSADTLATELEALTPTDDEAAASDRFAAAWEAYFAESEVAGFTCTASALAPATEAMRGALAGLSAPGAAAAVIQAAVIAFWGVVAGSAAAVWVTAPPLTSAAPPPGLSGISAALSGAFVANTSGGLSLADASGVIAAALHAANIGGTAVQSGTPPVTVPIT